MKRLSLLLACLLTLTTTVRSEGPENGKLYRDTLASGDTASWILSGNGVSGWRLRVTSDSRVLVDTDLGICSFCAGEEDNCNMNGIFIREFTGIDTPLIVAVCHVGAHSQQLSLFDPQVSASTAALKVTGSYFVDWMKNGDGNLVIEWDGDSNSAAGCKVVTEHLPEIAPPQNRLNLVTPCYRKGPPLH